MAKKKATTKAAPKTPKAAKRGRRGGRKKGEWVLLTSDSLRQYRKSAHLSRAALAETLGVSSTTIQNWESGKAVPTKESQARLADLVKGTPTASGGNGVTAKTKVMSNGAHSTDVQLTVTSEILKAFLATPQGGKTTQAQLVDLTRSLRSALG